MENKKTEKQLRIEFLYLDLDACSRCQDTEEKLDQAMALLMGPLATMGYKMQVEKVNVNTLALAEAWRFESSPTIRVNGWDILGEVKENRCSDCSDISGVETTCRVFEYDGGTYDNPPTGMILEGILKHLFQPAKAPETAAFEVPDNLKAFYEAEASCGPADSGCGCGCGDAGCC